MVAAFTMTACDSYLNDTPHNSMAEEVAYTSKTALFNSTVLDIYNYIGGYSDSQGLQGTNRGVFDLNSVTTDECIVPIRGGDWYDGGLWQRLFTHTWSATEAPLYNTWNYLYKVIMLCNQYIARIDQYKALNGNDTDVDGYRDELRAVRAIYYFYAMDLFGNIPLVTTTDSKTSDITQSKRSDIYWFAVKELQEVAPRLNAGKSNSYGSYYGRITQPVAYAYLAKLAINAEVYTDDNWTDGQRPDGKDITFTIDGEEMNAWKATVEYCNRIANAGFALETLFSTNFSINNETSVENIFTIPMDPSLYTNQYRYFFRSIHYCHASALGAASENGPSATIELLDAMGYGSDEDTRFRLTFYADTVYVNGNVVKMDDGVTPLVYQPRRVNLNLTGSEYIKTAGARWAKYEVDPNAKNCYCESHNDIVLLRYADILLMKAEALTRNGQDGSEYLNEVRSRSNMASVSCTLDNILRERFVELAWEGWRRNDLIRFGQFHKAYTDRPTLTDEANGYTTVFPIPQNVMDQHPTWKQNSGYEK